jgi:thiol-disulfide isomerase/thioredoxin
VFLLALLVPVLASCAGGSAEETATAAAVTQDGRDDPYAKLSLQDPQGRTIRLADFRGKVRLIDVWASWCGPCRMIIPHLNSLYDRYRGQGLVVIGVSVDNSPADVVAFTGRTPLKYPVGMMNPEIGRLLGNPDAIPTSYLVDRTGRLRRKFVGFVEPATIERELKKFLEPR